MCYSFTFICNFCVENLSLEKPSIKNLNNVSFSNIRSVYTKPYPRETTLLGQATELVVITKTKVK